MRTLITPFLLLVVAMGALEAQTSKALKSGDRPVFMSAQRLALLCQDWNDLNPGGHPPKNEGFLNVSPQQMARALGCDAYIEGMEDGMLEKTFGRHYHPVQTDLDFKKTLIDTFLKYVADHPEEQDFAASTILNKALDIFVKTQTPTK